MEHQYPAPRIIHVNVFTVLLFSSHHVPGNIERRGTRGRAARSAPTSAAASRSPSASRRGSQTSTIRIRPQANSSGGARSGTTNDNPAQDIFSQMLAAATGFGPNGPLAPGGAESVTIRPPMQSVPRFPTFAEFATERQGQLEPGLVNLLNSAGVLGAGAPVGTGGTGATTCFA